MKSSKVCHACEIFIGGEGQNRLGDHSLCRGGGFKLGSGIYFLLSFKLGIFSRGNHEIAIFGAKISEVKKCPWFCGKIRQGWSGLHTIQSADQPHSHFPRNPFDGFCITGKKIGSLWTGVTIRMFSETHSGEKSNGQEGNIHNTHKQYMQRRKC